MVLEQNDIKRIMPLARKIGTFLPHLNEALERFEINTPLRVASFLAQIAHESGELMFVKEIANGRRYEGRADLGNTEKGDGARYKGRGLIQLTGKYNYIELSEEFGIDFVKMPAKLEEPEWAVKSAAWFWKKHGCNELADANDQKALCKRINGGYNGLGHRLAYFDKACGVLDVRD
jgi:putative chitinase